MVIVPTSVSWQMKDAKFCSLKPKQQIAVKVKDHSNLLFMDL